MKTASLRVVLAFSAWLILAPTVAKAQKPDLIVQTGHSHFVTSVAFSPDGKKLVSGSDDYTIKLWDAESGQELRTLTGTTYVTSVSFSRDGKIIAAAAGTFGKTITLWDAQSGAVLRTLAGHSEAVESVSFSPDGKTLASGSDDKTIRLWDVQSGREAKLLIGHADSIGSVAFSPDGKTLASGSKDKTIRLWAVASGTELKTLTGHTADVSSVTFAPDGKTLASGSLDGKVRLWDIDTGKEMRILSTQPHSVFAGDYSVYSLSFSPNGKTLASGTGNWFDRSDDVIKLWDVTSGKELKTLSGHTGYIGSVSFSPDGRTLASGSNDKTIKLWDAEQGKEKLTLNAHSSFVSSLAFSADGETLAVGDSDGAIKFWDLGSSRQLRTFPVNTDDVLSDVTPVDITSVAFSPDGKTLASGSADKTIRLWDVQSGTQTKTLLGYSGYVHTLVFSPDGRSLASANEAGTINIWEISSGKHLQIPAGQITSKWAVSFSPNSKTLAFASADKSIRIWDLETGNEVRKLVGDTDQIDAVSFGVNGEILASASLDKTIRLWDVKSGAALESLNRESRDAQRRVLLLFPGLNLAQEEASEGLIAKAVENVKITLLERKGRKEVATLTALHENDWLVTTPEGFFDGTPNAWKQLLWRFNNNTFDYGAVELYFNDFFYPNLLRSVLMGQSPKPKAGQELEEIDRRQPKVDISLLNEQTSTQLDGQPANQRTTDKRMASVVIEVADNNDQKKRPAHQVTSGARDLRLFRNGSLVRVWRDDVFKQANGCEPIHSTTPTESRHARCRAEVPIVAGDNVFTAYAFNSSNVKSNDKSVIIKGADTLRRAGTLYVLAIGVNKYASGGFDLNFAVPDVVEIGAAVDAQQKRLRQAAQLLQYARTRIITLTDESATKENILFALGRFASGDRAGIPIKAPKIELAKIKQTNPEDALVIYYAGHGTAIGKRFYLLPHDFVAGNEAQLAATGISDIELNEVLERVDAGKLLMVIDACQSGQALGGEKEGRGPMNSKGLAQLAYDKGMYILTAAQSFQAAKEVSRTQTGKAIQHGLLTFTLLEGLTKATKDKEGKITEREWMNYAVEQVPLLQLEEAQKHTAVDERTGAQSERSAARIKPGENQTVQRPRVFYRRELETHPLIVAEP